MPVIIGNIAAFIASTIMVYSGIIKERLKIIYVQTISTACFIISNLVLGGLTGAIVNGLNVIRNILEYKEKLGLKEKIIISVISIIFGVIFNNLGLIGYLPLISSLLYLWLMKVKDVIKFKFLIIITLMLWMIYDISIKSYVSFIFYVATIIANIISIIQIKKN